MRREDQQHLIDPQHIQKFECVLTAVVRAAVLQVYPRLCSASYHLCLIVLLCSHITQLKAFPVSASSSHTQLGTQQPRQHRPPVAQFMCASCCGDTPQRSTIAHHSKRHKRTQHSQRWHSAPPAAAVLQENLPEAPLLCWFEQHTSTALSRFAPAMLISCNEAATESLYIIKGAAAC